MTKLMSVVVAILVATSFARPARAEDGTIRLLREALKLEEDRARDSQVEITTDNNLVKTIAATIPSRLQRAEEAEARAQAFRNAATALHRRGKGRLASAFEKLSATMLAFAKNDREEAGERKRAADILQKQAEIATSNRDLHVRAAAELREQLRLYEAATD
jgi:hypothetical protein